MLCLFSLFTPLSANAQWLLKSPLRIPVRVTGPSFGDCPGDDEWKRAVRFSARHRVTETMVDEKFSEEIELSLSGRTTIVSIQGGEATMFPRRGSYRLGCWCPGQSTHNRRGEELGIRAGEGPGSTRRRLPPHL
jgi:hypothetical protein